jgi:hypothetical protein
MNTNGSMIVPPEPVPQPVKVTVMVIAPGDWSK